jgi:hypothetical protein
MFSWWRRKPSVVEGRREIPSVGTLFTFSLADTAGLARPDAFGEILMKFAERPKPYRAVLVDLKGQQYLFSSGDLTGLVMAGVDQQNRRFVPCAVVVAGRAEEHLRELLRVTRLDRLDYLIVAPSETDALEGILRFVARVQDAV